MDTETVISIILFTIFVVLLLAFTTLMVWASYKLHADTFGREYGTEMERAIWEQRKKQSGYKKSAKLIKKEVIPNLSSVTAMNKVLGNPDMVEIHFYGKDDTVKVYKEMLVKYNLLDELSTLSNEYNA